jgi:hypothetical protein
MWRFYRAPVGADPHRQLLKHLFPGASWPFWARLGEQRHDQARVGLRLAESEDTPTRSLLVFALQMALAAAACAGTILAIFAWSGAGV